MKIMGDIFIIFYKVLNLVSYFVIFKVNLLIGDVKEGIYNV